MRKLLSVFAAVALAALGAAGCGGGSGDDATCGKALDSYNAALVASDTDGSGPNLTDVQERAHQDAVVKACDQAQFEAFIKGPNYDYSSGPDAIAIGDPSQVYAAFCDGAAEPNAC